VSTLVRENLLIGHLSLLTFHLPHFYDNLDEDHVHSLAGIMVASVERRGRGGSENSSMEVEDSGMPSGRDDQLFGEVTEVDVVGAFLESESFVEMKKLHTALLWACLKRSKVKK